MNDALKKLDVERNNPDLTTSVPEPAKAARVAPTLDVSSKESLDSSMKEMTAGMSEQEKEQFAKDCLALALPNAMTAAFQHALSKNDPAPQNEVEIFKSLHGMSAEEIQTKAREARTAATQAAKPVPTVAAEPPSTELIPKPAPPPTVPEAKIGQAIVIDEVKITIQRMRIGHLIRKSTFTNRTSRSNDQYLLVELEMENTSPGKIIYLQDIWGKTTITDEFDNIEGAKFSDSLFSTDRIEGAVGSAKLMPGERLTDMMIFDLPVEQAKTFVVETDPGFWRSIGEDRVRQLSDSKFRFRFGRAEIAPAMQ